MLVINNYHLQCEHHVVKSTKDEKARHKGKKNRNFTNFGDHVSENIIKDTVA